MTARKQIKKQHRQQQDEHRRALERSRVRRRFLGLGAAALIIAAIGALAFAFGPWSGSGEAEETLPSLPLSIGDNFFQPDTLRLQAGQKYRLEIRNQGIATHDVWMAGSDNKTSTGDDIRTDPIPGGGAASAKIKYDTPGTYYFVCTFHAGQGGKLLVE
jgi:plastocyanin